MSKIFFIITLFTFFSTPKNEVFTSILDVLPQSKITVVGKSNVNNFNCAYNIADLSTPLTVTYKQTKDFQQKDQLVFNNAKFHLKNTCFDCGNKFINKDFNKMLKTEEHPYVLIALHAVCISEDGCSALATMGVTIAGIENKYEVPIQFYYENNIYEVGGTILVNLDDFNIKSPKKVLGLIKVDNQVQVHLDLKLKELNLTKK